MHGEYYFILIATMGKDITYLPPEIRKYILSLININNIKLLCIYCSKVIISFKKYYIMHYNGYSIINNNCICNHCKKYIL